MLYYPDELKEEGDKESDLMKPMDHLVRFALSLSPSLSLSKYI
jgi:hypothetical protein